MNRALSRYVQLVICLSIVVVVGSGCSDDENGANNDRNGTDAASSRPDAGGGDAANPSDVRRPDDPDAQSTDAQSTDAQSTDAQSTDAQSTGDDTDDGEPGYNLAACAHQPGSDESVSTEAASDAILPQDEPWEVVLRNYMATLDESDFAVELAPMTWSDSDYDGIEQLFRQWHAPVDGYDVLRADAHWFTLENIENGGDVTTFFYKHSGVEPTAGVTTVDMPGNPHFGSRALKLRTFVTMASHMMMLHAAHQDDEDIRRTDFLGGAMNAYTYVYLQARDVLPEQVRDAFEQGLLANLAKMEDWGPTDVNTNMDTKAVVAYYRLGQIFCTTDMWQRVTDDARRTLFGSADATPANSDGESGIFHPAGYIGEADGPETSYNGIALYFLVNAAVLSHDNPAWNAFMPEVIDRMIKFKGYQYFQDPDGLFEGPSSYAKRTPNSYVRDQHGPYYRNLGAAMITDSARFLLRNVESLPDYQDIAIFDEDELIDLVADWATGRQRYGDFDQPSDVEPDSWHETHWGTDSDYLYRNYVEGTYPEFLDLWESDDPSLEAPINRWEQYAVSFDDDYWAGKNTSGDDEYAWNAETFKDAGWGYRKGHLGGGSLTAFWTRETGSVILGRTRGLHGDPLDTWSNMDVWATHHIFGYGADGTAFSTAQNRELRPEYASGDNPDEVSVTGWIGDGATDDDSDGDYARWAPDGALDGIVEYRRTFKDTGQGLRVTSEINTNGTTQSVKELWEALPIVLRFTRAQSNLDDTTIEFRVDGQWQDAGASLVTADAVRLSRFDGDAYIVFDNAQQVKISDDVSFPDAYHAPRIRHLYINMIDTVGQAVDLPADTTVAYELRPSL